MSPKQVREVVEALAIDHTSLCGYYHAQAVSTDDTRLQWLSHMLAKGEKQLRNVMVQALHTQPDKVLNTYVRFLDSDQLSPNTPLGPCQGLEALSAFALEQQDRHLQVCKQLSGGDSCPSVRELFQHFWSLEWEHSKERQWAITQSLEGEASL